MVYLDSIHNRERRQVGIADPEEMIPSRPRVTSAYHQLSGERALDTQVELQGIWILQIVVGGLQLILDVVRIEIGEEVRECRGERKRSPLRGRRIQASGEEVIFRQNLVIEKAESRANRGLTMPERVPGEADARREILE